MNLLEFRTAFWNAPVNGSRSTPSFTVGGRRVKSKYKLTTMTER